MEKQSRRITKRISLKVEEYINKDIKVGDKVIMIDGSSFTSVENTDEELYIVDSYPKLTGSSSIIKEIIGEVVETGIKNFAVPGYDCYYLQDIVVKIGKGKFRTASKMVTTDLSYLDKQKLNWMF